MVDLGKKNILGVLVDAVDYEASVAKIVGAAREGRNFIVTATAVHGLMTAALDAKQRHRLNHFDLVVPDGQPVAWSLNLLWKAGLKDRVYGPNLTLKLCQAAAETGLPVYFYGSQPQVLEKLTSNLQARFPGLKVAGCSPSLFRPSSPEEKLQIAQRILDSGAKLVFVGLGCPRQEVWAFEYRELLPMPCIAVGAAFDFHAGNIPQAPKFMQDYALEWLFRLFQEPTRLWKRYLGLNPLFLLMLARQFALGPSQFPIEGQVPERESLFA
jgi:N-acetylglucosaminyldiphosphoundecaprenol N-acetyl-beta-D-mannosaminyltransferase